MNFNIIIVFPYRKETIHREIKAQKELQTRYSHLTGDFLRKVRKWQILVVCKFKQIIHTSICFAHLNH